MTHVNKMIDTRITKFLSSSSIKILRDIAHLSDEMSVQCDCDGVIQFVFFICCVRSFQWWAQLLQMLGYQMT